MRRLRQPYEVSEELKLVSAHIQKMQDVPDDAEKIYNDYSGNIEELKVKLTKLQENKKSMLVELGSRKEVWKKAMEDLVETVDPPYQAVLSAADASGFIKFEQADTIEDAGLDLYVGFSGGAPTRRLDPFTQSGGERSVALMAFILSLAGEDSLAPEGDGRVRHPHGPEEQGGDVQDDTRPDEDRGKRRSTSSSRPPSLLCSTGLPTSSLCRLCTGHRK